MQLMDLLQEIVVFNNKVMKKIFFISFFFSIFSFSQIQPGFVFMKPIFKKTVIFNYTAGNQQWVVPDGVTEVFIDVFGAQGGNKNTIQGGLGAKSRGLLTVTPGETLLLMVGGQPTTRTAVYGNAGNGAQNSTDSNKDGLAGGGMSGVFRNSFSKPDALLIAAGGGGASSNKPGGFGGGIAGGKHDIRSGGGGTQTAGGVIGDFLDTQAIAPTAGSSFQGGNGGSPSQNTHFGGGGGGGGFFGGGGGVAGGAGVGSGGGGSSWFSSTLTKTAVLRDFNTGNGKIIIYYNE